MERQTSPPDGNSRQRDSARERSTGKSHRRQSHISEQRGQARYPEANQGDVMSRPACRSAGRTVLTQRIPLPFPCLDRRTIDPAKQEEQQRRRPQRIYAFVVCGPNREKRTGRKQAGDYQLARPARTPTGRQKMNYGEIGDHRNRQRQSGVEGRAPQDAIGQRNSYREQAKPSHRRNPKIAPVKGFPRRLPSAPQWPQHIEHPIGDIDKPDAQAEHERLTCSNVCTQVAR